MFLVVLLVIGFLWWMGGPNGMHDGAYGGHSFFGWLPLVLLFLLATRFFRGPRHFARHHRGHRGFAPPIPPAQPQDPALVTLRERFARGEIDRGEYEERRAILQNRQHAPRGEARDKDDGDKPEWPDLV